MAKKPESLEAKIQKEIIAYLRSRGWLVERLIGNAYQYGIPDLFCYKKGIGHRWIDVKRPRSNSLTKAQRLKWPRWDDHGIGIWILTAANQQQYDLLFEEPNWRKFWKKAYGPIKVFTQDDIDSLLDSLEE